VPLPVLTSAQFPSKLHKKHSATKKSTVIVVATKIGLGDGVNVNGTKGKKPTNWSGTITAHVTGDAWLSDNLDVDHEEERLGKVTTSGGTGPEDVSVTVTNTTATSDPVIVPTVPTVP
jgi:hypothetical protein